MKNILVHVTGSIACFKACSLISLLAKEGYEVQATASAGALRFIQPALLEGLSGRPLLADIFSGGDDAMHHITLSQRWADLIIAYPASANCICRLAAGLSDDLFGALCLANNYQKPLLVAPAMNTNMYNHPAVQEALAKLESWGTHILPTEEGHLACGVVGKGKLLEPETTLEIIKRVLDQGSNSMQEKK
ncbi:MAG: flavoprotein [Spirochaetaceae bacterium]|nr:flavoprotein [Spirochaetaceae bacterium]